MIKAIPNKGKIFLFASLLAILFVIDDFLLPTALLHQYKWYLLLFFLVQSVITVFITTQAVGKAPHYFLRNFFLAMLLRIFLSTVVVFYFVYQGLISLFLFLFTFFVLYFCFLSFEIYCLLHNLRADLRKNNS